MSFDYNDAFSRNIGILTHDDVKIIKNSQIGIAGMGGSGSNYLLALVRLGFENFVIADPDIFEIANMNRQAGANIHTAGRNKCEVMKEMALSINPNCKIDTITEGFGEQTLERFFKNTSIVIDALDLLRMDLHQLLHDQAQKHDIYSICGGAPFGYGAALTAFGPETISFNECFNMGYDDKPTDKIKKFFKGMTSAGFPQAYLSDELLTIPNKLEEIWISSVSPSLYLATAMATSEVLYTVIGRRKPTLVPNLIQLDMFTRSLSISQISTIHE